MTNKEDGILDNVSYEARIKESSQKSEEGFLINKRKKNLLIGSIIITLITAVISGTDNRKGGKYYGFPTDVLETYGGWTNSYYLWGFLINIIFYYLILLALLNLVKRFKSYKPHNE